MKKKDNRGGYREGAGRKLGVKFKEATVVMRVPVSLVAKVKALIAGSRKKQLSPRPVR